AAIAAALLVGLGLVAAAIVLAGGEDNAPAVGAVATTESTPSPNANALVLLPPTGPPIDVPRVRTPYDKTIGRAVGSPTAPVQLDLWSDYQCPACDAFAGSVMPELVKTYIDPGKARLTIHDMTTIGNESLGASISARCAERQGKYWQYH